MPSGWLLVGKISFSFLVIYCGVVGADFLLRMRNRSIKSFQQCLTYVVMLVSR